MAPESALNSVKPVFLLTRDLPVANDDRLKTRDICAAAEKMVGYNTIDGAQQIGGLWRIYPKTRTARVQLLVGGLSMRNLHAKLHDDNPFLVRGNNGDGHELTTTKVIVSNIPISFSNLEIENALVSLGCKPASKLIEECDRDVNGRLTRWKTGRRFMFVAVPASPLPTQAKIGMFTARIYHREQKNDPFCGNCLTKGHRKDECGAPTVCKNCHQSGHKVGDMLCNSERRLPHHASSPRETTLTDNTQAGCMVPYLNTDIETLNKSNENDSSNVLEEEIDVDYDDTSSSNEGEDIKSEDAKLKRKRDGKGKANRTSSVDSSPERLAKLNKDEGDSFTTTAPSTTRDEDKDTVT
jgi:hypothetical protein